MRASKFSFCFAETENTKEFSEFEFFSHQNSTLQTSIAFCRPFFVCLFFFAAFSQSFLLICSFGCFVQEKSLVRWTGKKIKMSVTLSSDSQKNKKKKKTQQEKCHVIKHTPLTHKKNKIHQNPPKTDNNKNAKLSITKATAVYFSMSHSM